MTCLDMGSTMASWRHEAAGYFFCLEDRALLCRNCDVAIHTVNSLVSLHQRFFLTGVKVGLEVADLGASSSTGKSNSGEKILEPEKPHSLPACQFNKVMPVEAGDFVPSKMPFTGGSSADSIQWQFDDFLALTDYNQNYNYLDNDSSKDWEWEARRVIRVTNPASHGD